jgi:hypothetical protein
VKGGSTPDVCAVRRSTYLQSGFFVVFPDSRHSFLFYISAVYLAPDVGKPAYIWFVEDVNAIVDQSGVADRILVLGDINLPKIGWSLQENGV